MLELAIGIILGCCALGAGCAMIAGIDLTDKDFWRAGLQVIADEIDEFCALVAE